MKLITKLLAHKQARFIITGATSAGLYFILVLVFLSNGMGAALSALIAYGIAFAFGYAGQKYFAFQSKSPHAATLPRYAFVQVACAVSAAASASLTEYLGMINPLLISFFTTIAMGLVSYWLSSRFVFSS